MFTAKKAPQKPENFAKLTCAQKKEVSAAIARANRTDKKQQSAQDSIPYERMWPDGICRVTDGYYTRTVQFQDINYQLSQNEDKTAIFEGWSDFLNYFHSSIRFQFSFLDLATSKDSTGRTILIPLRGDRLDGSRTEYTQMLQDQLAKGNSGLTKTKFLTFGIQAESTKAAKLRLERVETDVLNNFKRMGVSAQSMNGKERLGLLHSIFHMDAPEPFRFDWDTLAPSGLSTKDFIAPSSFEFKNGKMFRTGGKLGAVSFLQILAPELNDRILADFLDMESSLIVTMHIRNTMLATLNATYKGDAMGEAFRNHGKTDICIERDNRAAFVAECKMWTGQNEVEKAIKQLDSYLTWRDCKTALIYFVRRKDFLKILTTAKAALEKIPMMRQVQEIDRNEFKCTMVSECNPGQIVQVRVMLFNMDC